MLNMLNIVLCILILQNLHYSHSLLKLLCVSSACKVLEL